MACQEVEEPDFPAEGLSSIPAEAGSSLPLNVCGYLAVGAVEASLLSPPGKRETIFFPFV